MSYIFVGFRVPELKAAPTTLQGGELAPVTPFGLYGAWKGLKRPSRHPLAVLFLPGCRVWLLEPRLNLNVVSCPVSIILKEQGEVVR